MKKSAFALLAAALVLSCSDGGGSALVDSEDVTLTATPSPVIMQGSQASVRLRSAATEPLDWSVTARPVWLELVPSSGQFDGRAEQMLINSIDSLVTPGILHEGIVTIGAGGETLSIPVRYTRTVFPVPSLRDIAIVIPEPQDTTSTILRNSGNVPLVWTATSSVSWFSVAPTFGIIQPGDSARLALLADRLPLPVGTSNASVRVRSNTTAVVSLTAAVEVGTLPVLSVSRTNLSYPSAETLRSFHVRNIGKGPLTWTSSQEHDWVTVSPSAGTIAPSDSIAVAVTIDRAAAGAASSVTLHSNTLSGDMLIGLRVASLPVDLGTPIVLSHRVVDAEYSRSDLLVTVSTEPSLLNIIDPDAGVVQSIPLSRSPKAVSIAPNGRYAAVAHDSAVSYVDLLARRLIRGYSTGIVPSEIILGDNGWIHVLPLHPDQYMQSINLMTGVRYNAAPMRAGTLARLHPSGDYMYVASTYPYSIGKWDLRTGIPTPGYNAISPERAFGDLWLFEDGTRFVARGATVFRSSEITQEDMRLIATLPAPSIVEGFAHSRETGRAYAVEGSLDSDALWVLNSDLLTTVRRLTLPKFPIGHRAAAEFVFVNSSGSRVYVLLRADGAAGLASDWAYLVLDAAAIN